MSREEYSVENFEKQHLEPLKQFFIEANGLHSAPDAIAAEYETAGFLYAMVRLLKPKIILETGCYKGNSTHAMAHGAMDNKLGVVWTCDTDYMLVRDLNLSGIPQINAVRMEGIDLCERIADVDLAFLDSSGDRVAECAALQLSPKGVVVLHDSRREEYKPIWTMRPWASIWEIDTPRGLCVFQAP